MTFAEFNDLIGVEERYALAERFGGDRFRDNRGSKSNFRL